MLKTNRYGLVLGLGLSLAAQAFAQSEPADQQPAEPAKPGAPPEPSAHPKKGDPDEYKRFGFKSQAELEERRASLDKKRASLKVAREARFSLQLKKMRERAASLRADAAKKTNELDKAEIERRAQRLEAKAAEMEQRKQQVASTLQNRPPGAQAGDPRLTREQRSKMRKAQMRRRWGRLLLREDVIAELRSHAQRTARLRRIRDLARETSQEDLMQRSNKLLAREQQGHLRRMQAFERAQSPNTPTEGVPPSQPAEGVPPNQPAAVQPSEVQPAGTSAAPNAPASGAAASAPPGPQGNEAKP